MPAGHANSVTDRRDAWPLIEHRSPIVPTSGLSRPDGWIACGLRDSARFGRHNPAARGDASSARLGDTDALRSGARPEVPAVRGAGAGGYLVEGRVEGV